MKQYFMIMKVEVWGYLHTKVEYALYKWVNSFVRASTWM